MIASLPNCKCAPYPIEIEGCSISYIEELCRLTAKINEIIVSQNSLSDEVKNFIETLTAQIEEIINNLIASGEIKLDAVYTPETEDISFVITKEG